MQNDYSCNYCGHQFDRNAYYAAQLVCPSCQDRNITKLREGDCDVFGYEEIEGKDESTGT